MATFEIQTPKGRFQVQAPDEAAAMAAIGRLSADAPGDDVGEGLREYAGKVFSGDPEVAGNAISREEGRQAGLKSSTLGTIGAGLQKGTLANFSDEAAGLAEASGLPVGTPPLISAPVGAVRMAMGNPEAKRAYEQQTERARGFHEGMTEANPIASYGSQIAGGLALPAGAAGQSAKAGAALAGGYGALYGAGEGETPQERATGAAIGLPLGAVIGAGVTAALNKLAPSAAKPAGLKPETVSASDRIAAEAPVFLASDNPAVQRAAATAQNSPFGNPIDASLQKTTRNLTNTVDEVAEGLGRGAALSEENAGQLGAEKLSGYLNKRGEAQVSKAYDMVDRAVDKSVRRDPSTTRAVVEQLKAKTDAVGLPPSPTVQLITESLNAAAPKAAPKMADGSPMPPGLYERLVKSGQIEATPAGGFNYDETKFLRTKFYKMRKNAAVTGHDADEVKAIYTALSDDLRNVIRDSDAKAGTPRGLTLWERANSLKRNYSERRKEFGRILGVHEEAPPRVVYERLKALVTGGSREDTDLLLKARKAIGPESWDGIASAIVSRLGHSDANPGNINVDRLVTDWAKISKNQQAKNIAFAGQGAYRQALDDVAAVALRIKEWKQKYGNASGTAKNASGLAFAAHMMSNPLAAVKKAVGGIVLSSALSRPATAQATAKWAKAYERIVVAPSAGSLNMLNQATKQYGSVLAKEMGVPANDVVKPLMDAIRTRAAGAEELGPPAPDQDNGENQQENQKPDQSSLLSKGSAAINALQRTMKGPEPMSRPVPMGIRG